jgi:uncharacterized delta-60 repeat protein
LLSLFVATVTLTPAAALAASPGSLDSSFASQGIATMGQNTRLFGTAAQSDGKVVAVGESGTASSADVLVARFSSSGALDHSFGSGGLVQGPAVPAAKGTASLARAVAIQPDGKIVVVGKATTTDGTGTDGLLIERYNANGSLDHSFGSGGLVNLLSSTYGDGYAVAIQPDGKIVATGAADAAGSGGTFPRVAVVRLSSNGSLDPSFGSGGIDVLDLGAYSYAYAVALQGDGKIVIAGSQRPGLEVTNALIARLTPSGARDGSFAGSGAFAQQYAASGGAYSGFGAVAVQPDGKLVAAGAATNATGADAFAVRFTSSGAQDGSFGSGGVVRSTSAVNYTPFGSGAPGADAIAIAPGGDVVTAGVFTDAAVSDAALWAFTPGGAPDPRFGSHGTVVTSIAGAAGSELAALALDPSGNLVAVGDELTGFGSTYAGIAARYIGFGPPAVAPLKLAVTGVKRSYKTSTVVKHGLRLTTGCNESCTIKVSLTVSAATARKLHLKVHGKAPVTIASGKAVLSAAGTKSITLKLAKATGKALGKQKSVGLTLVVSATSTSTHKSTTSRKGVTFKR